MRRACFLPRKSFLVEMGSSVCPLVLQLATYRSQDWPPARPFLEVDKEHRCLPARCAGHRPQELAGLSLLKCVYT